MKKLISTMMLAVFATSSLAQKDGSITEKVRLNTLEDLISYVKRTESVDSVEYNTSRFHYFTQVEIYGITYMSDGLRVKGFLLQPKAPGIYPAIIYNRGGSLDFGSLTHGVASMGLGELARLASHGYVIAASQYRGNGGGEGREEYGGADIHDVLSLIPLLEDQPKADANRLGMFGWSRGGMTSFLTLKETGRIKALAVGGPSTNLLRSIVDRPELDEWWSEFIPNYNVSKKDILTKRSADQWVHKLPKNVPILILQGENDLALPVDYTLEFALKLSKHKVPYRLLKFEAGSHSLKEYHNEVFDNLFRWFDKYL